MLSPMLGLALFVLTIAVSDKYYSCLRCSELRLKHVRWKLIPK